jgi:phosphatidylinositol alpha-1,6-mannosyltransferase
VSTQIGTDAPIAAPPKALLVGLHVDRRGGLEGYTVDLGHGLQRLGWKVEAVSVLTPDQGACEGLPTQGLMPEWMSESLFARFWQRALGFHLKRRRRHPDVVIAVHPYTLALVGRYARRVGVPYVGIFHGLEAWADWSHAFARAIQACPVLAAVSRFTAQSVERRLTRADPEVFCLPPYVDTTRFVPGPSPERRDDVAVLLTVSRLSAWDRYKGHDLVLASMPDVQARLGRPVHYWIVGDGDDRARLELEARRRGVADRTHFRGRVSASELLDLYRAADVFVMPSAVEKRADGSWTGEGFGIVYIEAAACGLPVVALDQGGAREAVAHGETGLLVDRTEAAVGAAMLRLLGDRSLGRRMGRAGRARVCRDFSAEAFDRRISELMERTLSSAIPEPA